MTLEPDSRDSSPETPNTSVLDDDDIDYIEAHNILTSNQDDKELNEFNDLSDDTKLEKLNNLIKKSQVYSQIIADQILENTKLKKQRRGKSAGEESESQDTNQHKGKGHKDEKVGHDKKGKKRKQDVLSMLSRQTTKKTKTESQAIEPVNDKHDDDEKIKQPKIITGQLKDYQLDGLEWLITLYENGLNGILADEMGLGKTIQCISFISFLVENGIPGPYLIVAPLSTISNWQQEFSKFAPSLNILKYTGSKGERADLKIESHHNIVLTSFELVIKDFSKLAKPNWKFLIIDEGHRLKNMNCILIQVLKKFEVSNRLLITGTPLQNNLNELWSLLNFILPDIFHDLQLFQQWFNFDNLLSIGDDKGGNQVENKQVEAFIRKQLQSNLIKNLHTILSPFILRRLKRDVINNLPPKKEYLIHIELSDYQKKLYQDALNNNLLESISELYYQDYKKFNQVKSKNLPQLKDQINKELKHLSLRNLIMQLRQICNSPYNYYEPFPITEPLTKNEKTPKDKESMFITQLVNNSAKFKILDQLLSSIGDHKVLIFSQFTRTLDLLSDYLSYKSIDHCRFDGSTSQSDRDVEINKFKNPEYRIFLLSTRSGGLGINLVDADTVVLFDNDWNPQVDLQAIDRCHRIGQTKPVKIFRFLIKNLIEELLIMKNYSKRFLEKLIIRINSNTKSSNDDIFNYEMEFNNLLEISKKFGFKGNNDKDYKFDYENAKSNEILSNDEIDELMDRSDSCYKNNGNNYFKRFKNISIFETLNKLDDKDE